MQAATLFNLFNQIKRDPPVVFAAATCSLSAHISISPHSFAGLGIDFEGLGALGVAHPLRLERREIATGLRLILVYFRT